MTQPTSPNPSAGQTPDAGRRALLRTSLLGAGLLLASATPLALADNTPSLKVYGPGGPAPAMKEAATAFEKATGIKVEVTAGPTPKWIDAARANADLIFPDRKP
jgi:Accessory colonization factor AcfC, contains ABC-type periplasmic domain